MSVAETRQTIDAVWRMESARLIAGLTRMVGDVGQAEDLANDALLAALEHWPKAGVPPNPGAWLMTTAKRRAIDLHRRHRSFDARQNQVGYEFESWHEDAIDRLEASLDDPIGDDLLRLVFMTCHPVLPTEARVALTLRLLGGLTTEEIARAFLSSTPTIAQRIVRAKRTLAESQVPFDLPAGEALTVRLSSVLEVIYLIFNEGYSATAGEDVIRPLLSEEAMRLGRILAQLTPREPEVHGLLALMELQASRFAARIDQHGEPILLLDQHRSRWDQLMIRRGLSALARAEALGGSSGPYALQASLAACHARARTPEATDWEKIVALYQELYRITPSPVIALNRAVALGMAFGAAAGLEAVDALATAPSLKLYHLLPSVRGDLLLKLGRAEEAQEEFRRAAALTGNARERVALLRRAEQANVAKEP